MSMDLGMDLLNVLLLLDTEEAGPIIVHNKHSRQKNSSLGLISNVQIAFYLTNISLMNHIFFTAN